MSRQSSQQRQADCRTSTDVTKQLASFTSVGERVTVDLPAWRTSCSTRLVHISHSDTPPNSASAELGNAIPGIEASRPEWTLSAKAQKNTCVPAADSNLVAKITQIRRLSIEQDNFHAMTLKSNLAHSSVIVDGEHLERCGYEHERANRLSINAKNIIGIHNPGRQIRTPHRVSPNHDASRRSDPADSTAPTQAIAREVRNARCQNIIAGPELADRVTLQHQQTTTTRVTDATG